MAWVDKASGATFDAQYNDYIKDIFWHLNTASGSERLIKDSYNLDNTLLEELRMSTFPR